MIVFILTLLLYCILSSCDHFPCDFSFLSFFPMSLFLMIFFPFNCIDPFTNILFIYLVIVSQLISLRSGFFFFFRTFILSWTFPFKYFPPYMSTLIFLPSTPQDKELGQVFCIINILVTFLIVLLHYIYMYVVFRYMYSVWRWWLLSVCDMLFEG